jgi:hypothetical protein
MKFRKRFTATSIAALLLLTAIPYVNAAQIQPQTLLDADDNFGSSVAVFGAWAMVGAYGDDSFAGKVYVFRKDGTTWGPAAQPSFTPLSFSANDYFGKAVDMFGDMAVVGADGTDIDPFPRDPTSKLISNAGAAYIFELDGSGVWRQAADLTAYDPNTNTFYGASVGASSRYVIVGAPGAYGDVGAAYIYERPSTGWSDVLIEEDATRIMAPVRVVHDFFGASVAVSDEFAAAGAYGDDENGNRAGALYVFQRSGDGSWEPHVKLPNGADNPHNFVFQSEDKLGMSAAIDGDFIIAGAPGISTGAGKAYIFYYDGVRWTVTDQLQEPGVLGFGTSVAIKGNYAAVSTEDGPAFIYRKSGAGNWERDDVNSPFGPADGNGSVSEVDISAAGGVYEFIGGMPARNDSQGAAFIDDQEVSAPDDDQQPNVSPQINAVDDQTLRIEDAIELNLVISDLETPDDELTTRAEMTSDNLTEGVDISFRFSDADPAVLIIESLSTTEGAADFTVTVEDQCTANMDPATCPESDAAAFRLTVADIPGIDISDETPAPYIIDEILEGQPADPIVVKFIVGSPESMQNLDVSSSNETVIPDDNLNLSLVQSTEELKEYRLEIMPNEQTFGRVQITISATTFDGITVNETFLVTINSFPWVEDFPATRTAIKQDAAYTLSVPFSVHDVETPASELQAAVENYTDAGGIMSTEPGVKPVEPTDNNRVLEIPLTAGAVGEIALSLSVSDEYGANRPFQFTLNVVHSTDTVITGIWEQESTANLLDLDLAERTVAMNFGDGVKSMTIGISDGDDAIDDIAKSVSSSRTWASGLELFNCFENDENPPFYECTLSIDEPTAPADASQDARITITVSDGDPGTEGDQQSFYLAYNMPPTIEQEAGETFFDDGVVIEEDSDTQIYRFVIGDDSIESVNDYGKLEKAISANNDQFLELTEDDPGIYPFPGCADEDDENCWECAGGDCQIRIRPTPDDFGTSRIAIEVTDTYGLSTRKTFNITVDPVNDPPELTVQDDQSAEISAFTMKENNSEALDLVATDVDGDALTLDIESLNTDLIPNEFANIKICEVSEGSDPFDPESAAPPDGWICYDGNAFSLAPDASGQYSTLKLFIRPAKNVNSELLKPDGSVIGAGNINVSVADPDLASDKTIKATVSAVDSAPVIDIPSPFPRMPDDRDRTTAETNAVALSISHPDGEKEVSIWVQLHEDESCGTACAIPITSQNTYFIDSNNNIINATSITDEVLPGEPLALNLVLKPQPNVIQDVTQEKLKVVVSNADDSTLSTSGTITATIEPVNDAPTISGLKENYPCLDCDVESPWLQEMPQAIDFIVTDPDPQDNPTQLSVTAKWGQKDGADIDPTGQYTPVLIEGPSSDGQASLLVVPPDTGRLPLTVTVTDTEGLPYSQDTFINVQEAPPEIEPYPDKFNLSLDTKEDESTQVELLVSDIETDDLSQLTLLTAWRSITPDMPKGTISGGEISSGGLATLTVTPPADWPRGDDDTAVAEIDVTVRQPDGVRSETITFTLTIQATPDAPVLTSAKPLDPAPIIAEGGTYVIDFWIEDLDTRIDAMTIEPVVTGLDLDLSALDCPIDDPYRKRCEMTVKSPEQSFGDSIITITAVENNAPYLEGSLEVPLMVEENNEAPSFNIVGANPFNAFVVDPDTGEKSIVTDEDTLVTVNYEITDPDGPTEGLQVVPESLQWIWTASTTPTAPVELALIAQGNSIQITPTQNGFGEGAVVLQATDGTNTVSARIDVTVTSVNDEPVVEFTNLPESPLAESDENKTVDLELSISDVETDSGAMTPTFTVEWVEDNIRETLIAEDHILSTGTGEIRVVKFTRPDICSEAGAIATITARVTDGDSADPKIGTDQVAIEYTAVDFPPTIRKKNGLYFESIKENSGPHFVDFVVGKEPACRPAELVMTMPVITGDPELLPEGNYYFDPDFTGATRRLWLEPAQNKWGTVDITVSVLDALTPDQLESDPLVFTLRVDPVTHAPTISVLMQGDSPNQVYQVDMDEGETTEGMGYVIDVEDLDTPSEDLLMGAIWAPVSGREDEFVEGDIRFEGTGGERDVIITPEPYENGYAKITPWVKDSAEATLVKSQPFVLHVRPVNDPPVINAPIANPDDIVFVQGDETFTLRFQVWDRDSVLPSNSVSAESGNTALLPQNDVTRFDWGRIENPQDNMTHYLKMKPYPIIDEEFQDIAVTIKANDGVAQSTFPFTLRVVRNANPPQITMRPSVSVWEDQVENEVVDFKVTDENKDPQDLDVFVSSGDTRFVPNSLIEVEYIGGADVNWRLTFRPAADAPFDEGAAYTTPLIISAYNDFFEAVAELSVTIHNRNDAPEIVNIDQPETVYLNEPFEIFFDVNDMDEGPDDLKLAVSSTDLPDAVYEFSPEIGTSRTLKVFPNLSSPAQRSIDITITVTDNSGVVSPSNGEEKNFAEETVTVYMAGPAPGDVDGSGEVGLGDVVASLQVLSGIQPNIFLGADVDGDGRIGFAEAFNALTYAAGQ